MGLLEKHPLAFLGACCCVCISVPTIIMVSCSFWTVQQTEVGLDYSSISKQLDSKVYAPGLYFLGLGHHFITFPTTLQTMQFSTSDHDLLHTRTSDGLPLTLGVTFQYQYEQNKVYDLYNAFLTSHRHVLFLAASNIINELGTHYSAHQFLDNKRAIAYDMREALNHEFASKFFCRVNALQIRIFELPAQYDAALQTTITTKQNITATRHYVSNVLVALQTNLIVAHKDANVTVESAYGQSEATLQLASASANVTRMLADAQADAFSKVKSNLTLTNDELLQYMYYNNLAEATNNTQLLVGISPQTYIGGK